MEKNNGSKSSLCRRIRQAIASIPAFRRRQSRPATTFSNSPSSSPPIAARTDTCSIQNKPHDPHHLNGHSEGAAGVIPVNFDYSSPTSNGFANSANSGAVKSKPRPEASRGSVKAGNLGSVQQGQTPELDNNDTFSKYIQQARRRIRTSSNVGAGDQSNSPSSDETNGSSKKEDQQKDQFSVFIQHAKKKIRTTSSIGKTSSLNRG